MTDLLCLAHLSVIELTPPEVVETAAAAGFRQVSLRLAPAAPGEVQHPMLGGMPMMRETLARLRHLGVSVHDVELVSLSADMDLAAVEPLLDAAAELGARQVLVAGDHVDEALVADRLRSVADRAARRGLRVGLEFMPWRGIGTLASALRVVAAAGAGGVLVDAIHLDRSGGRAADIAAMPSGSLAWFQLCDAPRAHPATPEELLHQARRARLAPGEGGLDLIGMLRALPPATVVSLEVPMHAQPGLLPPVPRARALRAAALRVMEQADAA